MYMPVCTPNDFNTSIYNTEFHACDEELHFHLF